MKEIIESLKALEASEEAKKYLLHPDTEKGQVYLNIVQDGPFKLSRLFYAFEHNGYVEEKPSPELASIISSLTLNMADCISYQNAEPGAVNTGFYDALRERGYEAGNCSSRANKLIQMYWINTKSGLFLLPRHLG